MLPTEARFAGFFLLLTLGACDTPPPRPSTSPAAFASPAPEGTKQKEGAASETSVPPTAPTPLIDVGIFSDLDDDIRTECPSWLDSGPGDRLVYPKSAQQWLAVQGIAVCSLGGGEGADERQLIPVDAQSARSSDRDLDGYPDAVDILRGVKKAVENGDEYKNNYHALSFPGGDVPRTEGVCTDVIVRSLRNAGLDLQLEVSKDIAARPRAYPMVKKPDPNIDHRRVRTLLPYFVEHTSLLPKDHTDTTSPYLPGDVLFMNTMGDSEPEHMGIVSDRVGPSGLPLIINNWTDGTTTKEMDLLGRIPVTHRFRVARAAVVPQGHAGLGGILRRNGLVLPEGARQIVLVTVPLWTSTGGTLTRFERDGQGSELRSVGETVAARIGRTGLGRGRGLHDAALPGRFEKAEGDGRSPAGMFAFGTAFGRRASLPRKSAWPYRQTTERDYFVDAPGSPRYNTWVHLGPGEAIGESAERLVMYEWGLVVEHNTKNPVPRGGSAIFLHVVSQPSAPTIGCTSLEEDDLLDLLSWLDPEQHPVLVQVAGHPFDQPPVATDSAR